ncbi:MAG: alpha/beta fold hydrolase [candidate division KSB1 bacterium]|nr:alpha/beta fold hydrolase [candidate division KSB1 bacterium]
MREYPVAFSSEGHQLVGMLHLPEVHTGRGVVMCHGFTGNKVESRRLFVEAARAFAEAGLAAFRFDFYGSGDSEGDFADTSLAHNIANLIDALAFMKQQDCNRLAVLGVSLGGATAILTLARHPVDAFVGWSVVPDLRKLFEARAPEAVRSDQSLPGYEHDGWFLKRQFWEDAVKRDVLRAFRKLAMPKLLIQGDKDDPLFVDGFRLMQVKALPPADFYMIPGAGHMFETVRFRHKLITTTVRWLRRHLR